MSVPSLSLREWCDQLVRAHREQDYVAVNHAARMIGAQAEQASPAALDEALAVVAPLVSDVPVEPGGWLAMVGADLVRHGAAPEPLVAPVFGTLYPLLGTVAALVELWPADSQLWLPDPDAPDVTGAAGESELAVGLQEALPEILRDVAPELGENVETVAHGWWHLGTWTHAGAVLLTAAPQVRDLIPSRNDVIGAVLCLLDSRLVAEAPYRRDRLDELAAQLSGTPVEYWANAVQWAHLEQDGRRLHNAVVKAVQAAEHCPSSAREAALEPLAEVIADAPPEAGRWAALAAGAFVESGATPDRLVTPIFTGLLRVMELAWAFVQTWQEHVARPLPDPVPPDRPQAGSEAEQAAMAAATELLEPHAGEYAFGMALGWYVLTDWLPPASALLNFSTRIAGRVPERDRLTALTNELCVATDQMAGLRHALRHLAEDLSGTPSHDHDHDHEHDDGEDPRLAAAADLTTARLLADSGDLTAAAAHIGVALTHAPDLPMAYQALLDLAARIGMAEALALFPISENTPLAYGVGRAHLLGAGDDPHEGLELLVSITLHDQTRPWATVPWVQDPELPRRLDPTRLAGTFLGFTPRLPSDVPDEDRAPLLPYLTLGRNAVVAHPEHGPLHSGVANLARRIGARDEAIALALRGEQLDPTATSCLCTAMAYSSAGRVDESVAAYERVLKFEPDSAAACTDVAELLADADRLDEALDWVERAVAISPQDPAAFPTACALRFSHDRSADHLVALADYLQANPEVEHAFRMLAQSCAGQPWLAGIPGAVDAVAQFLENPDAIAAARADLGDDPEPTVGLPAIDSPSGTAMLVRLLPGIDIQVQNVPQPDPRQPRRAVRTSVWTFDGFVPKPAVAPPSAEGARAVADVAMLISRGWPFPIAVHAATMHLGDLPLTDLLGVLAYPPELPTEPPMPVTLWTRAVQVAACVGLLHHRASEPWANSVRRQVLVDLAFGIEDWVTEAALFALVVAAWVDPAVRDDVVGLLSAWLSDLTEIGVQREVNIDVSVALIVVAAPGLPDEATKLARFLATAVEDAADDS